jgi:hypothetical protein
MLLPRAARPLVEVELEIGVAERDVVHALERRFRERRPAEVRVDDHAGRVQHTAEARPPGARELCCQLGVQVARVVPGADLFAGPVDHTTGSLDRQRIVAGVGELVDRREIAQLHHVKV